MITSLLVEAYTQCQFKAFLLLQEKIECKEHEYSRILKDRATANRRRLEVVSDSVKSDLIEKLDEKSIVRHSDLVADCDAIFEKKVCHTQSKPDHLYEPCIAVGTYSVTKEQRRILAFSGFVTSAKTKIKIISGIIVTLDGQKHRIDFKKIYPMIAAIVEMLRGMLNSRNLDTPKLFLNKHCPLCPFNDYCRKVTV